MPLSTHVNVKQHVLFSQISEGCIVKVRVLPSASSPVKSWNEELNTPVKFEKQLPGVLLTTQPKVHRNLQVMITCLYGYRSGDL